MAQSTVSLLGLYNYDNSILDDLALPPELEESRETITDNLLFETSEMEILYPDPAVLKAAIRVWSRKSLPVWQKLYATTQYEYNPIWNKDGTFTELETRNLAGTSSNTETRNLASTSSNTETRNLAGGEQESGSGSDDTINYVYGYNSETKAKESESEEDSTYSRNNQSTQTGTIGNQGNTSDTGTIANQGNTSDTGTVRRERTEQGNIGITSTQELIEKQRAVVEFNIMDRIIADFKQRFCLMVY